MRALGTHYGPPNWGVDRETRLIMGYHSFFRSKSDVVYGRDNVALALRVLNTIVEAVAVGRFLPDATRSGMFPNSVRQGKQISAEDEISLLRRRRLPMRLLGPGSRFRVCVRRSRANLCLKTR